MDQSTPTAVRDDEATTQGIPHIDDPFIQNATHESDGVGNSPTFVLLPLQRRRQIGPQRRGTVSHLTHPHQRSHDRTVHHSQPSSPQGFVGADGTSTLCSSPVSGEDHPSPSFTATMPASPVSYFSSPPLPRTDEEEEQDIVEKDESDGDKWSDSLRSSTSHSREHPIRNGIGSHRRSSTGASTLLDSRSATLLNSPTPNDSSLSKGSSFLHNNGKLDICEEAEEFSDREKEKLEGSVINDGSGISEEIWPMTPTVLTRNLRYSFRERHIEKRKTECVFEPLKRTFEEDSLPKGWMKIIGPEGFPYFWHSKFQIITDTWIPDEETHKRLWDFFKQIQPFMKRHKHQGDSNVHLVLDVHEAGGQWWCGYYLVDHSNFSVFWYEEHKCTIKELQEIQGGKLSVGFMKVLAEWEYWKHWCLFPDLCPTPSRVWKVAQNYIRNAQTDVLTADRPATNYTFEKLRDMMSIVTEARESYFLNTGKEGAESLPAKECPWFIGRFMEPLARERFLNFYGEKHARIDAKQSVHGEKARLELSDTSLLFRVLSPLLFCAPEVLFKKMEMLWVDRIVYAEPWNHFFDTLSEDWAHQLVYASILLTSNIAFLTVPNVTSEDAVTHGTFVQIPSYVSTIATIGSIILGLALNRQHQNRNRSTKLENSNAEEIHEWLMKRYHKTRGLEPLAVMYSLPFALLMWGMVTFLTSFTLMCFNHTTIGARVLTAISWFLIFLLVVWFWWMSWDNTTNRWASSCGHMRSTFKNWKPFDGLLSSWSNPLKKRASPLDPAPAVDDAGLENGIRAGDVSSVMTRITAGSLKNFQIPESAHLSLPLRKVSTHNSC